MMYRRCEDGDGGIGQNRVLDRKGKDAKGSYVINANAFYIFVMHQKTNINTHIQILN